MMTEMNASANHNQFSINLKNAFIAQSKCKPIHHRDGSISVSSIFRPESDSPKLRLYPSNVSHDIVTGISYSPGQNAAAAGVDLPSFTPAKRKLYAEARAERQRLREREQARKGLIQQAEYLAAATLAHITDIDQYDRLFDSEMAWFERYIDDRAIDQFIAKQRREQAAIDHAIQQRIDEPKPFSAVTLTAGLRTALSILLTSKAAYFFYLLRQSFRDDFTVQEVAAQIGWSEKAVRRYLKSAFYIRETGQRGKAKLYGWAAMHVVMREMRALLRQAIPTHTRDLHNKQTLADDDVGYLAPEHPKAEVDADTASLVKWRSEQRIDDVMALLDDELPYEPPMNNLDEFVWGWIQFNESTAGRYHFERERLTGMSPQGIGYHVRKHRCTFVEVPTKATKVSIERDNSSFRHTKRKALHQCQAKDPKIQAVKHIDKVDGKHIFMPIPPRRIESATFFRLDMIYSMNADLFFRRALIQALLDADPPTDDEADALAEKSGTSSDMIYSMSAELCFRRALICALLEAPDPFALPNWPRWSLDMSAKADHDYHLWQMVVRLIHAGEAELNRRGGKRYLESKGRKIRATLPALNAFDRGEYVFPPPPDGYIEVSGTPIPF